MKLGPVWDFSFLSGDEVPIKGEVRNSLLAAFLAYWSCHKFNLEEPSKSQTFRCLGGPEKAPVFAAQYPVCTGAGGVGSLSPIARGLFPPHRIVPGWLL